MDKLFSAFNVYSGLTERLFVLVAGNKTSSTLSQNDIQEE